MAQTAAIITGRTANRAEIDVDPETGLSQAEVERRRGRYGVNAIEERRVGPLRKLLSYFWGPIPWMIEAAAILSAAVQRWAGTLTRNELTVGSPVLLSARNAQEVILVAALASTAESPDAIDRAVIAAAEPLKDSLRDFRTIDFVPFDPVRERTEARIAGRTCEFRVAKGAPQAILELCGLLPRNRRDDRAAGRAERLPHHDDRL